MRIIVKGAVAAVVAGMGLGVGVTLAQASSTPAQSPYPPPPSGSTGGATTTTTTPATTTTTTAPTTTPPPAPGTVTATRKFQAVFGTLLADPQSMSLYTLTNAGAAVPCSGQCAQVWPPFEIPAGAQLAVPKGVTGVSTTPAADGSQQVTFRGLPVYRFAFDKSAADVKGEGIESFGGMWHLAVITGPAHLSAPAVGQATTPDGGGYWLASANGGVFNFGDAGFFGSLGAIRLASPIVGIATTPDGKGYWLVGADGGVFTFGDAGYFGSTGGQKLAAPVIGITPTPDGHGYWLTASDGGVFSFGDAAFNGSAG